MNILITGASGFLGNYIKTVFQNRHHTVHTLGRSTDNDIVTDLSGGAFALSECYNAVIHVAGKAHLVPTTRKEEEEFYSVNLQGTKNLLQSLHKKPDYFVFISTVSVYGLDEGENITEEYPLHATEAYGKSKLLAEEEIQEWGKQNYVKITILRIPLLAGHEAPGNLASMIKGIKKGFYFNIGAGNARKSMVLAEDVALFIPEIMKTGGIYNLTDGHHPSFKELSEKIAGFYHKPPPASLNRYMALALSNIGEWMNVFNIKIPLNRRQFSKMTHSLTFDDAKARHLGWNPDPVLKNTVKWLK